MGPETRKGPVTWDGVELMITGAVSTYNERVVEPIKERVTTIEQAQTSADWKLTQIMANQAKSKKHQEKFFWAIIGMISPLVADLAVWFFKNLPNIWRAYIAH